MKRSLRTLWMATLVLFAGAQVTLPAQEPTQPPEGVPPQSDYMYRIHYSEVEELLKGPVGGRFSALQAYVSKLHPKSKILQFVSAFFLQIARDLEAAGQGSEAARVMGWVRDKYPEAAAASKGAEFKQAFDSRDYRTAIRLGEELYAGKPDQQVGYMLGLSYLATNNTAKSVEWSRKLVGELGARNAVQFAVWLARHYQGQNDTANALRYYDQVLKAYPNQGPGGWSAEDWSGVQASAYLLKASDAYQKEDFATAAKDFEECLQYQPHNDVAYLYLGLSHWKAKNVDLAIDAFAKGAVLDKPGSAKARQYLEQLYKARNKNSLNGLDELLGAARLALKL